MPTLNLSDSKQTLLEEVKLFGRFNYDLRDTVVLFIYLPKPQISQPADFSYFFCFTSGFTREEECLRIAVANLAQLFCCSDFFKVLIH